MLEKECGIGNGKCRACTISTSSRSYVDYPLLPFEYPFLNSDSAGGLQYILDSSDGICQLRSMIIDLDRCLAAPLQA